MWARCTTAARLRSPYLISKQMSSVSSSASVLPFDPSAPPSATGDLWESTPSGGKPPKVGTTRTFFNTPKGQVTTISSLGDKFSQKKGYERRELVRKAVGAGVKELKNYDGVKEVYIDASTDPHAAGKHSFCVTTNSTANMYAFKPLLRILHGTNFR